MERVTLLIAAACVLLSAGLARFLKRRYGGLGYSSRVLLAGVMPTVVIVVVLSIMQVLARMEFDRTHHEDGFMGPLLLLLYGFPLVLGNLLINLSASAWFGRGK